MTTDLGGTRSSLGTQILSNRPTSERFNFGTSGRTQKIAGLPFEHYQVGRTAPDVCASTPSGFGVQSISKRNTEPAYKMGNRFFSDNIMTKESRPGPGTYQADSALGKQSQSLRQTLPSWHAGTAGRFSNYRTVFRRELQTPGSSSYDVRPASGWLGDAPKYSMGRGVRYDTARTLPANAPSYLEDPGPGNYEAPSSLGPQYSSTRETAPKMRVGTADRGLHPRKEYRSVFQQDLVQGLHSPGPGHYDPGRNMTVASSKRRAATPSFGSGDRFSDVRPRHSQHGLPGHNSPGPGSYVV